MQELPFQIKRMKECLFLFSLLLESSDLKKALLPVLVAKSCLPVCNPMNCSTPGSSVHGVSQARILQCETLETFLGEDPVDFVGLLQAKPCGGWR